MRKLISLTRLGIINSFIERADIFLYTISNCIAPLVILFVWLSFTPAGAFSVYSHDQLIWYFLLVMLIKLVTSAWGGQFLAARIRRGAISPYLAQPMPYVFHYLSNNLAEKIVKLIILLPFLGCLIILFRLALPTINLLNLVTVFYSTLIAMALFFIIDIIIGLLSFWFDETTAIGETYGLLYSLFSGVFIPLTALPPAIRGLGHILPFRFTLSLPIEIFLNQLTSREIYIGLLLQLVWLLAAGGLCRILWLRGLKIYSASGA